MTVRVWPVFFREPRDVDPDEAAALDRAGLLRAEPADADSPTVEDRVTVRPVFTGLPTEMDAAEADALRVAGLLMTDEETD